MLKFYNMYIKQLFLKYIGYAPTTLLYIALGKCFFLIRSSTFSWDLVFSAQPSSFVDKCQAAYALYRYYSLPEDERTAVNRKYVWGSGAGVAWNESKVSVRSTHSQEVDADILACLTGDSLSFDEVIEIGTGNGRFLKMMLDRLGDSKRYVGLDLSSEQVAICKERHAASPLVFSDLSLQDWIASHGCSPNALVVARGCLEYFSEKELILFFSAVYAHARYVLFVEPVNIDTNSIRSSVPRGGTAFSHSYPYMLSKIGFHVEVVKVYGISRNDPYYNNIFVVAKVR